MKLIDKCTGVCLYLLLLFFFIYNKASAQICGTPGLDGPANISVSINTYFPVSGNYTLTAGSKTVPLSGVPPNDPYGNNFGLKPISKGDLLLIIQMQDALINYTDDRSYGSNNPASGRDALGGTGFLSLESTGIFEYAIATSDVPLTGGTLTFKGFAPGGGSVNTFENAAPVATRGARTFQVVRVPQYSNLVLSNDIKTPPFNGRAGGIIAFDVSGTMDFNGFVVDASARGFRGGYGPVGASESNINSVYVIPSSDPRSVGKGEGIAGTPRYMWDGFNRVDNGIEGLPGGSYGKGAPANAGGGGNDHNSGGGGGGNGGAGGVGGDGVRFGRTDDTFPNGGRPGSAAYLSAMPEVGRLIMGGGGGGGDANDALDGVKGGVGGGIILINAGSIKGSGTIRSNGSRGAIGISGVNPDGAGGGGAGGTIYIKVNSPDLNAQLNLEATGGDGGNTARDENQPHGPGGGGGGGMIFYTMPASTVLTNIRAGTSGITAEGSPHEASGGSNGYQRFFAISELPPYLQSSGSGCYPELTTQMTQVNGGAVVFTGSLVKYQIIVRNAAGGGNAGGVEVQVQLPEGFVYESATAVLTGDAGGPSVLSNLSGNPTDNGTPNRPLLGDFNISPGDAVIITLIAKVTCGTNPGRYSTSAQAIYLDPSRTLKGIYRRITARTNAFSDAKTNYETGSGGIVPGMNFNGIASTADDITLSPFSIAVNHISKSADEVYCVNTDPQPLLGSLPSEDEPASFTYQWQISDNGTDFTDLEGANAKDYDPEIIISTRYYRRQILHLGCPYTLLSNIIRLNVDVQAVLSSLADVCAEAVPFQLTQGTEKWGIIPGRGTYSGTGVSPEGIFSPGLAGVGVHPITYTFVADNSCSDSKTQNIRVLPTPVADGGEAQVILQGGQTKLKATAGGLDLTYKWTPATGLDRDDVINPVASPAEDMTYTLTVTSGEGCKIAVQAELKVLTSFNIPNAFSPNGDGINDQWTVKYLDTYPNAKISVFNRFGAEVFSGNSGTVLWDGKYKGADQPTGTYYYLINPNNGRKVISGSLTIIR